jgi:hypothetical protein
LAGFHVSRREEVFKTSTVATYRESIQIVHSSSKADHKNQSWKTMTRTFEELSRDEHMDLKLLVEYIKTDLFPKAKFVLGEDEWDVGGRIYKDCIKCCKGRIGRLQPMRNEAKETHMEKIWMMALNKKLQKKALVQKRSAIYTVMQNKFTGKTALTMYEKSKRLFLT